MVSQTPVLDAEKVSIALASVMESKTSQTDIGDKVDQAAPVSRTLGTEEEKGYISIGSKEHLIKQSTGQPQIELSSPSRTAEDDIVREIVVLDKITGSKYKVITVKFPSEDHAVDTERTGTSVQEKPAAVQKVEAEHKEQQDTKGAVDAEKEVTQPKIDEKESVEGNKNLQAEQSRKSDKPSDKKKDKEVKSKENEKKTSHKSNSKQDKKRSKRNVDEQKKTSKGKGKYSSKNQEKKYRKGKY